MPRPLAVLLTIAAAAGLLLVPAPDASAVPPAVVSPGTVRPGDSFTVSGTGCWDPDFDPAVHYPYEWTVSIGSAVPAAPITMTAASGGAWSATVQVPASWQPGMFAVEPWCRLSGNIILAYPKMWVTVPPPVQPPVRPPGSTPSAVAPPPPAPRTPAPSAGPASTAPAAPTTPAPVRRPPCDDCRTLAGDEPVPAGSPLTLSFAGYQPGEQVTLVMRSTPVELGTFTADASGVVTATFRLPESAEAGSHSLTFSGALSGDHVVRFQLAAAQEEPAAAQEEHGTAATPAQAEGLPRALVLGAGGVLLLGGGLVVLRRRRTPATPSTPTGQPTETPIAEPIA